MGWLTLGFEPLDVLLFRDHRPFDAGAHNEALGRLPSPGTLYGALRSALFQAAGADFDAPPDFGVPALRPWLGDAKGPGSLGIRGPWLARLDPTPAAYFAPPIHPDGWLDPAALGLRVIGHAPPRLPWPDGPHRKVKDAQQAPKLLDLDGLLAWQRGERLTPTLAQAEVVEVEPRTGIARSERGVVREGLLYTVGTWRFARGHGLALEVEARDADQRARLLGLRDRVLSLGGKGHMARIRVWEQTLVPAPRAVHGGWRALLLTPTLTNALPPGVSMATRVGMPEGGFDLQGRRPRALRGALPAGTVIFGEGPVPAHPAGQEPEHQRAGYGAFVLGGFVP